MAQEQRGGRSVLMLRATREEEGARRSNVVWGHEMLTIPRHLRDVVVTEYGVAELRGRTDEDCIRAMLGITDAAFQRELAQRAIDAESVLALLESMRDVGMVSVCAFPRVDVDAPTG